MVFSSSAAYAQSNGNCRELNTGCYEGHRSESSHTNSMYSFADLGHIGLEATLCGKHFFLNETHKVNI